MTQDSSSPALTTVKKSTVWKKIDAAQLADSVDLRDVVRHFWGDAPVRKSAYNQYPAPDRAEKVPSYTVYPDGFKDFGSGENGDIYAFLQKQLNTDFKGAIDWLYAFTGGNVQQVDFKRQARPATNEPPDSEWQGLAAQLVNQAQGYLWSDAPDARKIRAYLTEQRLLSEDAIRLTGLGYNPTWQRIKKSDGSLIALAPGIIIPVDSDGVLWSIAIRRRIGDLATLLNIQPDRNKDGQEVSKYTFLEGSKTGWLYGEYTLKADHPVLLVEGQFDAILAHQVTGLAAVTLGAASNRMTSQRREQLRSASRVILMTDSDTAGQIAASKYADAIGYDKIWTVSLPAKDVTDVVKLGYDLNTIIADAVPMAAPAEQNEPDASQPRWFSGGLPDSFRRAINRNFEPSTALVMELVIEASRAGLIDPDAWTMKELIAANLATGAGIPDATLRRIVASHTGETAFFSFPVVGVVVPTADFEKNSAGRKANTFRVNDYEVLVKHIIAYAAPRIPEKVYGLDILAPVTAKMLAEVEGNEADTTAAALQQLYTAAGIADTDARTRADKKAINEYHTLLRDLADLHSSPLPTGWRLDDPRLYRAAFTRAVIRGGERLSRAELSRRVGVPESAIPAVMKLAGFEGIPQTEAQQVNNIASAKRFARQQRGKLRRLTSYTPAGESSALEYFDDGSASQFIETETGRGATVFAQVQVANLYSIVRDTPAEIIRKPSSEIEPTPEYDLYGDGQGAGKPHISYTPAAEVAPAGKHYGPTYDPAWIYAQLRLALKLLKSQRYQWRGDNLLDRETGELIETPDARQLINLILDRQDVAGETDYDGLALLALGIELGAEISVGMAGNG